MRTVVHFFAVLMTLLGLSHGQSLRQISNFGANPSGARMYLYTPTNLAANRPIVVAIHYCSGTASAYFSGTPYRQLADQHGFAVIYPESPYSGGCWDVSSPASLSYEGGGNSNAIANMVRWTLQEYSGDASRVFVTGTSSGAMMTNVMAATYPDMFAAGIAYAGVPAGCFYTGTVAGWNSSCANGQSIASQEAWANTARNMRPGYTGTRPKMQIYHGGQDNTIYPQNYQETIKQWSGVFGYPSTPVSTQEGSPTSQFRREIYGERLQGIWGQSIGHNVPIQGQEDMLWFGITGGGTPPPGTTPPAPPPATTTTTQAPGPGPTTSPPPPPGGCTAQRWGQCGGNGWTGCTTCVSPYTCQRLNDWYSQCL